ncbi:MAG TPA: alpha/beta fold hydrolase, partial [Candidatus Paceibacterota bacterium]|nr:alpha/beta fold hydrolase [Candidatus Paceibacterota bacterium]
SETPAYFEIAENGTFGVFREVTRDEDALRIATLPDIDIETAFDGGAAIDDYIVHHNTAYFTTNEESPLMWSLFAYDPDEGEAREIDRDVAYTDFMRSVGDALLYHKVEGARGQVYSYRNGVSSRLPGQAESNRDLLSVEEETRLGDVNGVLWDNDDDNDDEKPLIVWLHGGPQRQTSVGYHPFLSYAVYDEMLERFVRAGARVAKLDYTGSTGYGARFQKGLTKKVGVADVDDVTEAIDDLTDEFETSDVFLVGNSYGGYLALKTLVEEPRLIDGVAAIAAVTDWDELIGTNRSSIFAPYFGGIPSTETDRYYDAAEIMDNLDEIPDRTPIVIAYGERDATVPTSQSRIFIAGAENDKNLSTVVFPDEEHIIRKRSSLDRLCDAIAGAFDLSAEVCS